MLDFSTSIRILEFVPLIGLGFKTLGSDYTSPRFTYRFMIVHMTVLIGWL